MTKIDPQKNHLQLTKNSKSVNTQQIVSMVTKPLFFFAVASSLAEHGTKYILWDLPSLYDAQEFHSFLCILQSNFINN